MAQDGLPASPEIPRAESKSEIQLKSLPNDHEPILPKAEKPTEEPINIEERLTQIREELTDQKPGKQLKKLDNTQPRTSTMLFIPAPTGINKVLAIGEHLVSLPLRKATEFILLRSYGDFISPDRIKESAKKLTIIEGLHFIARSYRYNTEEKGINRILSAIGSGVNLGGVRRFERRSTEVNGLMMEASLAAYLLVPNPLFLGVLGLGATMTLPFGLHETVHDLSASRDGSRVGLHLREQVNGKTIHENRNFNELAVIDSMGHRLQKTFKIPTFFLSRLYSLFYPGPLALFQWERMRQSLDKKFGKAHTKHLVDLALFYDDGLDMLETTVDEIRGKGSFQKLSDRSTTSGLLKGIWGDFLSKIRKRS